MRLGTEKDFSEESFRLHGTKLPIEVPSGALGGALGGAHNNFKSYKRAPIFDKVTICQQLLV